MTIKYALVLMLVGGIAGVLNAVAGGGSFISFPTLIFLGMPPVEANATNTVALWFGLVSSGRSYRRHLAGPRILLIPWAIASAAGGAAGALLLLHTPQHTFLHLIPWLLLLATTLFAFGDKLRSRAAARSEGIRTGAAEVAVTAFILFLVGVYGGYFGAGIGFMQMAVFAVLGMNNIHAMNATRLLLALLINLMAVIIFITSRAVYWPQEIVMMIAAICGGWIGAHYAQKLEPRHMRRAVIVLGLAMSAYFFIHVYG